MMVLPAGTNTLSRALGCANVMKPGTTLALLVTGAAAGWRVAIPANVTEAAQIETRHSVVVRARRIGDDSMKRFITRKLQFSGSQDSEARGGSAT